MRYLYRLYSILKILKKGLNIPISPLLAIFIYIIYIFIVNLIVNIDDLYNFFTYIFIAFYISLFTIKYFLHSLNIS